MKKITKILSGTLLVALMSFGLATKLNARNDVRLEARDVLTEDFTKSVTGKVVRRAGNEEAQNKISAAKAQIADAGEGKRHIRFVVGLDSVRYADAKFDIVAKNGDTVVKTFADQKVTTAYTHIEAAGVVQSAAQVFGLEYNYLVAFTVNNVPQAAWDYKFEITASVKTEEAAEWTTSEVVEKVITKIAKADEEIAEPAFDWQGVVEGGEEPAFSAENAGKNMTKYAGGGIGFGSYFNTETKSLYMGISIQKDANPEWWAAQLFAVPANVKVGYEYEVSFDFYSPVEGTIRVRQKDYPVVVGTNNISYVTQYNGGTTVDCAPFALQFATPNSSREEITKMFTVDGDANPYVISNFFMREIEKEVVEPGVGETRELKFSEVWNPHGNIYLAVGWSNSELTNTIEDKTGTIVSYKATAIIDGTEYPFVFGHADGTMAIIIYNNSIPGIEKATYTLVLELVDINNVCYRGVLEVVNGKKLTLDSAKINNVNALNGYFAEKGYKEALYSAENWALINSLLEEGIANVNAATTIADANAAMNNAMASIDAIEQLKVSYADVVFYNGETEVTTIKYVVGEKIGEFPSVSGFDVTGWYSTPTFDEGTEVTVDTIVSEEMKLYAKTVVSALPTFDVQLNSAVGGAWIYCSITWQDGYALTDSDVSFSAISYGPGSNAYADRVGGASISGNTIKIGIGFNGADFIHDKDITLTITVTTGGVTYNIAVAAHSYKDSGIDYDMVSVVTSFA